MRRRRNERHGAMPRRLRAYDPRDWPNGPQSFYDAHDAWRDEHPEWEGTFFETPEEVATWPDVPWDPEVDPP